MTIIITNCTSRKRISPLQDLSVENIQDGSFKDVAVQWQDLLMKSQPEHSAKNTYCGRSFREVEKCSDLLNAPLYVISAGLGVVDANTCIPWYNITTTTGTPASIGRKICDAYSPSKWWNAISQNNPYGTSLVETLEKNPVGLILCALSRPYIDLIKIELESLPSKYYPRLRFLGKNTCNALPKNIQANWLPYDERLECIGNGYSGTQSDFAQRALKHFVYEVLPMLPGGTVQDHQAITLDFLSHGVRPEKVTRLKKSDDEIVALIRKHWNSGTISSTEVLRIFRSKLGISCEQSRCRYLYDSIKQSLNTKQ